MDIINDFEMSRQKNISIVKTQYEGYYNILNELFEIGHNICDGLNLEETYIRILGIVYTKGLVISKSIYSLIIDGYGQESGALLRSLLEIIELIKYIREDETRINEIIENKLPTAGKIAQIVNGNFFELRKYLNDNASHFNLTYYSVSHVIDINDNKLKPKQRVSEKTLINNITTVISFLFFLCREIVLALHNKLEIPNKLVKQIDMLNLRFTELQDKLV